MNSVYCIVQDAANKWPTLPAIIDEQGSLTFAALESESLLVADALKKSGITPGMGVGVMTRNNRSFLIGLFGALAAGAVVVPIAHQLREAELSNLLENIPLQAIINDLPCAATLFAGTDSTIQLRAGNTLNLRLRIAPDNTDAKIAFEVTDAAFIRFTSGTTGKSKGVILSHRSVMERIDVAQNLLQLSPGDKVTWVLPMAYHFVVSIVLYVRFGACVVTCKDLLASSIIEVTNQHQCSLLYATPIHYRMLSADNSGAMMPSLRQAVSTSSPISAEVARGFFLRFKIRPTQVYGLIEVGLPLANTNSESLDALGTVVKGYTVAILDEQGNPVAAGRVGQLAVSGPGMFDAYLAPFTQREDLLSQGYFLTGDYALSDAQGSIHLMGRKKSLINIAGNKVFPEEVEAVLNAHAAIESSRVFAERHPLTGETVCAELVIKEGTQVETEEIKNFCYARLSSYKVPKELKFVSTISLTPTGKVIRHENNQRNLSR